MLTGTHHTSFTVSDLDRSLAFYRDVLGLEVTAEIGGSTPYVSKVVGYPDAKLRIAFLRLPGTSHRLELIQYLSPAGDRPPLETKDTGSGHLAFLVDDMLTVYEALRAKGVRFRSPPVEVTPGDPNTGRAVYFADPDGITLELIQRPRRSG
ncbi:MAG: VOC family protein [Chloroflexi bacterium]|nr:VOC family protein [Chloroflexota bacterium]